MTIRSKFLVATVATLMAGAAVPAMAVTLRYANQGDLKSLDPYTLNETTTIAHLGHVYEGLTKRGKDLAIEPGLAERWEISEDGLTWRFFLRKNVKFHNGNPFTADDVIFSATRVRAPGSNFQTRVPSGSEFVKVDDYTVDVKLKSPNPIMNAQWDTWYIMDKEWAEANNAVAPTPAAATTPSFAALNANGTGPFKIESHQPGVKTVFKPNKDWWGKVEHNLDEIVFTPIASDATRVAALLSGEVDVIEPVPLQDIQRVNGSAECQGADRPRAAHDLPRLRPDPRRAAVLEREGQEPVQGQARARGLLQGDRHRDHQVPRHARPVHAVGADDRAGALQLRARISCVRNTTSTEPRSSWPMPATRTASRSAWTARTTATSMTRRSARPWSACSPASASR